MLKRFEVKGFKNFSSGITLDFTDVRDYQFNPQCVRDGLLNKLIVYGKNSVGKSNLGLAMFDITTHLTDKNVTPSVYDYYLSADIGVDHAEFYYLFQFGQSEILYRYHKTDVNELTYEEVFIDDKKVFSYDFIQKSGDLEGLEWYAPSLNFEFKDSKLSILRYIVNNTPSNEFNPIEPLKQLVHFVSRMLWFRSLDENRYIGYKAESADYYKFIFESDYISEFEEFLHKSGVQEKLVAIKNPSGENILYFNKEKPIPFFKVASNGTKALYTFFYWLKTSKELSFLFIDEFDAYYHVELAEAIVELLEAQGDFQTILTSHNTNLLSNRTMRPDCYFILTPDHLVSFANATGRELREGHNLEKLYISGEFNG